MGVMAPRISTRFQVLALAVGSFLFPGLARACSVCLGGTADNRIEFILTTALLTFLPLGLIGGLVYGFRRRYLSLARQEPSEDVPSIPRHDSARATLPS